MGYGEPTEIYKQLKARQVRAEADPLEVGVNLAWSGSSLKEDVTPPSDYPHHQSNSPNPPRAFHSTLLDPVEGVSSRPWSLTLIEPLKVGTWRFSQVWRVEATQVEQPGVRFPLVVKIYQESLFPIPEDEADRDSRGWHLPPTLIENESNAYRLARGSQGTDIPLCYGFYRFQLHSREEAVGVVLEDLVANREGITVDKFLEREAKAERLTLHAMDRIMCAALELQDRLLESGLASILHFLDQFVILRSSDPYTSEPTLIGFGFSDSSTRERIHARFEAGELEIPRWRWRWKKPYQNCLFGALPGVVTSVSKKYETLAFRWGKLEKKRKRLEFLCLHEVIPEPPEAAEQAELEQQEQDRKDREELHLMLGGHLSDLLPSQSLSFPEPSSTSSLDSRRSSTRPSASPWTLTLVEALQCGANQWSQVWRARATPGGDDARAFSVVLKLYHQALFPPPELRDSRPEYDSWNWVSSTYKQEREALVYRRARDSQGSDIPICYGFYRFLLPSGEEVVGVVLEDLVEVARGISLREFLFREARANRMSAQHFNIIACEALQMQNRFHELGLAETSCDVDNFLYLRTYSSLSSVTLVGIGFGKSMSKERNLLSFAADYKERGLSDDFWCQDEQYRLFMALKRSLWEWESDVGKHNVAVEWADNEDEKETLTFLKRPWC